MKTIKIKKKTVKVTIMSFLFNCFSSQYYICNINLALGKGKRY